MMKNMKRKKNMNIMLMVKKMTEIVPNEILRVANAIEEKVVVAVVVDDGKVACDICGKKY